MPADMNRNSVAGRMSDKKNKKISLRRLHILMMRYNYNQYGHQESEADVMSIQDIKNLWSNMKSDLKESLPSDQMSGHRILSGSPEPPGGYREEIKEDKSSGSDTLN